MRETQERLSSISEQTTMGQISNIELAQCPPTLCVRKVAGLYRSVTEKKKIMRVTVDQTVMPTWHSKSARM